MFVHVFAFRWKPGTTPADQERAAVEIRALQGRIPEVLEAHVGTNTSPRGHGYTFGGVMKFESRAAFHTYEAHPAHQDLLKWLVPLIEPLELDFEA
jgi:hypothetical protein